MFCALNDLAEMPQKTKKTPLDVSIKSWASINWKIAGFPNRELLAGSDREAVKPFIFSDFKKQLRSNETYAEGQFMNGCALVVAPHHDDECFGCGGLIAKLITVGWNVHIVVVFAPIEGTDEAVRERTGEATAAAATLGVERHADFAVPCRASINVEAITWKLVALMRRLRPTIFLIPHENERDPEHQAVHHAGVEACWLAEAPFHEHLGVRTTGPGIVLGYEIWTPISRPTLIVDISDQLQTKLASLGCYKSQIKLTNLVQAANGLAVYRGAMFGDCQAAEAFQIVKAHEDSFLPFARKAASSDLIA